MAVTDSTLEIGFNTSYSCDINGIIYHPPQYPSAQQFYHDLEGYAICLYIASSLTVIILAVEYIILIIKCLPNVPPKRRVATCWIWSVFLIASIMSLLGIITPKSSDFVWLSYRVYLGLVMINFVELTISWHGGQKAMVRNMNNKTLNMRVGPCCCIICCCPKETHFSRKKIQFIKICVNQLAYIQLF